MLKIATIIVTYNGEKWIENCISSISNSAYQSDVFLVDNASTDTTLSILNKEKCFEVISLKENSGFGFANNLALKKAMQMNYDYFFLINQDVYVEPETLTQLIGFAEENSAFGIVCPIQFNGKGSEIDFLFQNYISLAKDKNNYFEASFANAAAWLVSKKCIETVGLFHPLFNHYGEDKNYCNRTLFHGFKIGILKNTKVLHDRSQTQSLEKIIALSKIKLLTIFINPNFSNLRSILEGLKSVLGISKYIIKKYRTVAALKSIPILMQEYFKLLLDFKNLQLNKTESKKRFL